MREWPRRNWLPEFAYAVICCRPHLTDSDGEWLRAQAATIDWELFEKVAQRHRIEGLVWGALRRADVNIPADAVAYLKMAAQRIAQNNLLHAAECDQLKKAFREAGVPLLFVKGVTLGALAYGSILIKHASDIDILVPPRKVLDAAALLAANGYNLVVPPGPASPKWIEAWHRRSKESGWRHSDHGTHVELHTSLSDHPMLLTGVDCQSPQQEVRVLDRLALPTLQFQELFAYLAVHGASSAWFRLKWIADLAALVSSCSTPQIEQLYRRSQELGAGRCAGLALLLMHSLFDASISPRLQAELQSDRVSRWLVAACFQSMSERASATELHDLRLGTIWIHLAQFGLLPGFTYKMSELRRQGWLLRNAASRLIRWNNP